MSESNIVRRSRKQLRRGETDWAAVEALTDEDIDKAIAEDPDASPILDEEWFKGAVLTIPTKMATSMRIDGDVIEWFRSQGKGWQTKMNAVLRAYVRAQGGVK
jgi:uncharacterized protein (DUF4415 family)